jgi:hypothetical protein
MEPTLIDPGDDSRLRYLVTGTVVAVTMDNGSEVDTFTLPEDLDDDDLVLWLLDRHLTVMALGTAGTLPPPEE